MSETTRYYISDDDPVVRLMEDHKKALADIERLRAALTRLVAWEGAVEMACPEMGGLLKAMYDARAALKAKDE